MPTQTQALENQDHPTRAAELLVAAAFSAAGWDIFLPQFDKGIDFIAGKLLSAGYLLRPVQVRGKYPEAEGLDHKTYGVRGALTVVHPSLVLAIPFFSPRPHALVCTAYLPLAKIGATTENGLTTFTALVAKLEGRRPKPRQEFVGYFDAAGLALIEDPNA